MYLKLVLEKLFSDDATYLRQNEYLIAHVNASFIMVHMTSLYHCTHAMMIHHGADELDHLHQ